MSSRISTADADEGPPRKRVRWQSVADEEARVDDNEEFTDTEETEDPEEESSGSEQICLAIACQNGRIGCAYFDPVKLVICVLEDTVESTHMDTTILVVEQVSPNVILTSSKSDEKCIDILRDSMKDSGGLFQIRPAKDLTARRGLDRLLSLNILSELPANTADVLEASENGGSDRATSAYDFMRRRIDMNGDPTMKRWNASIRMANFALFDQCPLCLSAIGALLDHLTRERAVGDLHEEGIDNLEICGIEVFTVDEVMQINADALHSLQIFEQEDHASVHSDKSKEGLSLYGILNHTKTLLGRNLLRQWLLRPSLSIQTITARHDAVECFLHPENISTADDLHQHLAKIKNVPRILNTMKSGKAKIKDWQGLFVFSFHAAMVRDSLGELNQPGSIEIVEKLMNVLDVAMCRDVGTAINETIDWEESAMSGRVCVRLHIDEELDNKKHVYAGIDSVLSKVARDVSATTPDNVTCLNVVYFPQLGFLICTPMLEEWCDQGMITAVEGWDYQFSSDASVYFKSEEMRDLDAYVGDLHSNIVDKELEIVHALQERVMVYEDAMIIACDLCAELDCLLSFSEAATTFNFVRPTMSEENVIDIIQGRHPLQELVVDTFVPNDARLVGGRPQLHDNNFGTNADSEGENEEISSIIICTGANACGKSVFLKQVALIQFMAQIGCFVPAESAKLGIVDKIFTRVQTRESVSKAQSAFMIDLNQVSLALRNCTERSLILLDEFGKGTMSTDGAGLFCGLIKHLLARGSSCPKVLVATHFHQVNAEILSAPELSISFVHMQVMFTTMHGHVLATSATADEEDKKENAPISGSRPGDKITYLYRVAKGLARHSHAAKCAELCGLSRSVVERAQHVSELYSAHALAKLFDEEMSKEEEDELQETEAICRRFLAWDLPASEVGMGDRKLRLAQVLGRSID